MKSSYRSTWKTNLSFLACRTVWTLKINKLIQAYDINPMPLVYVIPEKHVINQNVVRTGGPTGPGGPLSPCESIHILDD